MVKTGNRKKCFGMKNFIRHSKIQNCKLAWILKCTFTKVKEKVYFIFSAVVWFSVQYSRVYIFIPHGQYFCQWNNKKIKARNRQMGCCHTFDKGLVKQTNKPPQCEDSY